MFYNIWIKMQDEFKLLSIKDSSGKEMRFETKEDAEDMMVNIMADFGGELEVRLDKGQGKIDS